MVLEKNANVGGAAITEEFHPGFRNSVASYTVSLLNPKVIKDLELHRHGLRVVERKVANFWPVDDTRSLVMPYGLEARQRAIAAFSERDAERLPAYDAALDSAAEVLKRLVLETPPNAGGGLASLWKGARLSYSILKLPFETQRNLAALFTESAADYLARWFENETVRAMFAFDGIVGTYAAPSTPGTAYVLLHHCFGEVNGKTGVWGHAIGGMGAISAAIAAAAREKGAKIRTEVPVSQVVVENGRAVGVALASGEVVRARAVAAAVAPKLSVLQAGARRRRRAGPASSAEDAEIRLRQFPHERGAFGAAAFHLSLRGRSDEEGIARVRHNHGPDHGLSRTRLSRRSPRWLVERTHRGDADPIFA